MARRIPSYVEHTHEAYVRAVESTAQRLRDVADEIERNGKDLRPNIAARDVGVYSAAAGRVIHSLTWGVANAHSDSIITAASEADRAHAETEEDTDG